MPDEMPERLIMPVDECVCKKEHMVPHERTPYCRDCCKPVRADLVPQSVARDAHRALIEEAKAKYGDPARDNSFGADMVRSLVRALEAATQGPTRDNIEAAVCYAIHFEYGQDESDVREALRDVFDRLFPAPRKADAVPKARCGATQNVDKPFNRCTRAPHPDEPEGHAWPT